MDRIKFRTLARNWDTLGEVDPLFGVLSDPTKQGGRWDVDEFFESGRAHIKKWMRLIEEAAAPFAHSTCLDFGCGVGRLTIPLSEHFQRTIGVDVARSMIESARRFLGPADRCQFIVNTDPDLRQFPAATFDFVHSCLVLQHIPPEVSLRYIAECFRVTKPGGIVAFQMPAATRSDAEISALHALPDGAHVARLVIQNPPATLEGSERMTIRAIVGNDSRVAWPEDIPAGRHICLANHWLHEDGAIAIPDDGRARLPRTIGPGDRAEVPLTVQAPSAPGRYILEIDLVQEQVCWFAEKGSQTARASVQVSKTSRELATATSNGGRVHSARDQRLRPSLLTRFLRWFRGGAPVFEMYTIPRAEMERVIAESGGVLVRAIDDNAAGPSWISYTYICRRL
jgi:SAM-dependent methyltransferase